MNTHVAEQVERSIEPIDEGDLARLCAIAMEDSEGFFARHPKYKSPVVCIALCQGAALHYVDGQNGVKDFDLWTLYARTEAPAFPVRRRGTRDFGESKFGRNPNEVHFVGRRVDLFGRTIEVQCDPVAAVQSYLRHSRTRTACELSQKAVVLVYPVHLRGQVVWPLSEASGVVQ